MTCVLWNAVPRDWEDAQGWPATALAQCQAQPWTLLVLHDLPTGTMARLRGFIDEVRERGGRFCQDFPAGCVPLRCGEALAPLDAYVTPASEPGSP